VEVGADPSVDAEDSIVDATRRRHFRHGPSSTVTRRNRLAGRQNRVGSGEQERAGKALSGDLSFDARWIAARAVPLCLCNGRNNNLGMRKRL
jgi:hypothetical protein